MKPRSILLLLLILTTTGMNGQCDTTSLPGVPDCGLTGQPSVRLTVTDSEGNVLPFANIAFSVNGGEVFVGSCTNECRDFAIAFNAVGRFDILVGAPGYQTSRRMVDVSSSDDCNPDTEDLIVVLSLDNTVAALAGAWEGTTLFGDIVLRFGTDGEIIGAILFDRTIAGDGNFYISYNDRPIRGVPGQPIAFIAASDPTRTGDIFDFTADTLGVPVGFEGARMDAGFATLTGLQPGSPGFPVTYTRLADIPEPLQDP
ncbi:MAG: carboxypeptidase-like regulatory domain-containing protein [Phycisphaerae bacterium]